MGIVFVFPIGILVAVVILFLMLGGFFIGGLADGILQDPTGALKAAFIIAGVLSVIFWIAMLCDENTDRYTGPMYLGAIVPTTIALAGGLFFAIISMADFVNKWEWYMLLAGIPVLLGYCIGFILIITLPLIVVLLPQGYFSLESDKHGIWWHLIGTMSSTVLAIIYSCVMCIPAFNGNIGFYFNLNL